MKLWVKSIQLHQLKIAGARRWVPHLKCAAAPPAWSAIPPCFWCVFSVSQGAGTENPGLFSRSLCPVAVLESPSCAVLGSVHASAQDSHSLKAQPQKAQCRSPNAHCFKECGCCSCETWYQNMLNLKCPADSEHPVLASPIRPWEADMVFRSTPCNKGISVTHPYQERLLQ